MKYAVAITICLVIGGGLADNPASGQNPLDRRVDRNERQLGRQASRMSNRADYYSQETWTQLNPWVDRYSLQPLRPMQRAADAVVRSANAAERATNVAAATVDQARFGYNDAIRPNSGEVWFYDYYTYRPSYYYTSNDAAKYYNRTARYYDYDNDGVYESFSNFRDSDQDGRFDEFDRYDFAVSDREARDDNADDSPDDSTRYTITGKIDAKKTGRVNGIDFLIVRVKQRDEQSVVVDLGPAENWSEIKLQIDDSISAIGSMEKVGDKAILMAEVATISQKQIRIERPSPMFTGTVEEVTRAKVSDSQHVFVVVATQDGNQLVDLGPVDSLKVTVTPKAKIVVHGIPVRMQDHQVVLAEQIDLDGHSHSIPRWK